jgi:hypothetical protein
MEKRDFSRRHCIDGDEVVFIGEPIPIAHRYSGVVKSRHISAIYEFFIRTQEHISEGRVVLALARQWVAVEVGDNVYRFMLVAKALLIGANAQPASATYQSRANRDSSGGEAVQILRRPANTTKGSIGPVRLFSR